MDLKHLPDRRKGEGVPEAATANPARIDSASSRLQGVSILVVIKRRNKCPGEYNREVVGRIDDRSVRYELTIGGGSVRRYY